MGVQYGFLAQNIQELFPELVTEDEGSLAVNYQGMIPVLVEALKSLSEQNDSVAAANLTMTRQLIGMQQRLEALEKAVEHQQATSFDDQRLYRLLPNHPNPFNQSTTIRYQVSAQAEQVRLIITNRQGVEVQRFDRLPAGSGEVHVTAGSLTPGIYVYTLFADGLRVGSRKLVLTR
ncbi:T9SS type A sorting domain-containing protein [Larkinella soli]|uniref:T9SS type A sorting domain-containing protein n=1 Tax=Larkinella soli TaxID=1770527 RepID=UPI000FFC4892|nr:T9SS type A sorting domain-containing protein [Larkinella soli]